MDRLQNSLTRVRKNYFSFFSSAVSFLVVDFVYSALIVTESQSDAATSSEPYSDLVIAGQSNAQGDMSFHYQMNPPLGSHPADAATKIMWSTGDDQLTLSRQYSPNNQLLPLTSVQPFGYFGPEVGLARSLWDQGRRNMVILKVTYGLQRIAATGNSAFGGLADWNVNSVNESYDDLQMRKNQLASIMQSNGDTYTMDGFYWVQGESDAVKGESVENYQNNLEELLSSVHTDLGMHPDAINVLGKVSGQYCISNVYNLAYNPNGCGVQICLLSVHPCSTPQIVTQGNTNVRQALQNVSDEQPETYIVETEDMARGSDWIHMTADAQLTVGTRMANSGFELPYREEGSSDYDGDGILNIDEDLNGDGNLGNDDSDGDHIPDYLDEIFGEGGGRTRGLSISKSVSDSETGSPSVTRSGSTLNWKFSLSNDSTSPVDVIIEENISSRQSFVGGSLVTPPSFSKEYSTDDGQTFSETEPGSGITSVRASKSNIPISAKGDATSVEKDADTFQNSTSANEGYVPIVVRDRIFTLFNNTFAGTGPTANRYDIGCVEKSTGSNCVGYPKDFTDSSGNTDFISPVSPGHYLDEETQQLYVPSQRNVGFGIVCFDTTTNAMCTGRQYTALDPTTGPAGGTRRSQIHEISKIGSCLYAYDMTLKVYSFDPVTASTPCAGHTTKNLVSAYGNPITAYSRANHGNVGAPASATQSEVLGTKIYITMNYAFETDINFFGCNVVADLCRGSRIICFDSATVDGRCSNNAGGYFSNPMAQCYNDLQCKIVTPYINKIDNSICVFGTRENLLTYLGMYCFDSLTGTSIANTAQTNMIQSLGTAAVDNANYLPTFEEVEITLPNGDLATIFSWKKAYLIASPRSGKAVCFNWTTNSPCSGFGNTGNGTSRWDTWSYNGVTSAQVGDTGDTNDYGYTADSSGCIWAKGKSGDIWSFDAQTGAVPCRRSQETVTVQPQQFFCEVASGQITGWNEAKLQMPIGTSLDDLSELTATMKDSQGNVIEGYENIDLLVQGPLVESEGSLDISDLSYSTYSQLSADITFKANNGSPWSSGNSTPLVVLTFAGNNPEVCYQTQVDDACNITTPLTNDGVVEVTDQNLATKQVSLSATSIVQYDDGESCVPDIRVTTSSPPGKIFPGAIVTYDILVENIANGDPLSAAHDVSLSNTIPSDSTYVSSSAGGTLDDDTVSWPIFTLDGSASQSFSVTVIFTSGAIGSALNQTVALLPDDPTASNNSFVTSNEIGSLSAIGGTAWFDENANGTPDGSETYMENIEVELYKGDTLVDTFSTDSSGYVEFVDLLPGSDYTMQFIAPTGYLVSTTNSGPNSILDESGFITSMIELSEGELNQSTLVGFYLEPDDVDPPDDTPTTTTTVPTQPVTTQPVANTTATTTPKASSSVQEDTTGSDEPVVTDYVVETETTDPSEDEPQDVGRAATTVLGDVVKKDQAESGYKLFGALPMDDSKTLYISAFALNLAALGLFAREKIKRKRSLNS